MLNSTPGGIDEYEKDVDEALGLDTITESGNKFSYATVFAHFVNINGPGSVPTFDLFEGGLRWAYNNVCEELDAVGHEDIEYNVRLKDCADSIASLISFLKSALSLR